MRTLITTVAIGEHYSNYVPVFLYSVRRAYPEHGVLVHHRGPMPPNVADAVDRIGESYCVLERDFDMPGVASGGHAMAHRWLALTADDFKGYDAGFVTDIDFFVCRDEPSMLDRLADDCAETGLPYSNFRRRGLDKLCGNQHFIVVEPYFRAVEDSVARQRDRMAACQDPNTSDERILYRVVTGAGLPVTVRRVVPPHTGIHLGISRVGEAERLRHCDPCRKQQFIKAFDDPLFVRMVDCLSAGVRAELESARVACLR